MSLGGRVSPWRSAVEEGRSPLGRFRKPEPCFPRTYATWDAKKDENRFGSVKFRLTACSTPSPVTKAQRFTEEETADFIARYYSDETSYALKPAMMDGAFRAPCDRALLLKLAGQQPRRDLAVIVMVYYPNAGEEDTAKLAWVK